MSCRHPESIRIAACDLRCPLCMENEIERLQGELSQVREILWDREAEIERLQAELVMSKNNPRPKDEG